MSNKDDTNRDFDQTTFDASSSSSELKIDQSSLADEGAAAAPVELFGGAIICNFPKTFVDLSTIRQVPDNQEVWLSCPTITNSCFIVEILQLQKDAAEDNPLDFFFHDLVTQNLIEGDDTNCYYSLLPNLNNVQNYSFDPSVNNHPFILGDYLTNMLVDNTKRSNDASPTSMNTTMSRITVSTGVGVQYYLSSGGHRRDVANMTQNLPQQMQSEQSKQETDENTWIQIELCLVRFWSLQTDILITHSKPLPTTTYNMSKSMYEQADELSKTYDGKEFNEICKSFKIMDWNLFAS